jgi:hypothetical protein
MSPVNFNLFSWIREGVKQSVVLGVSDAIETIGTPDNSEDISPKLLAFLRRDGEPEAEKRAAGGTTRKRLGRTLKDLDAEAGAGVAAEG